MAPLLDQIDGACVDALGLPRMHWELVRNWIAIGENAARVPETIAQIKRQWLGRLAHALGSTYRVSESRRFLLLTAVRGDTSWMLEYAESAFDRILQLTQDPSAPVETSSSKCLLLVLTGEGVYRQYIRHFSTHRSAMLSPGMWVNDSVGGQIILPSLPGFKPTMVHELTHLHLAPRQIPRWLDEGMAERMTRLIACRPRLDTGTIARQQQRGFWLGHDIQSFWSGAAFRAHTATPRVLMAYELAELLVSEMTNDDLAPFQRFLNSASAADAGERASQQCFGVGLGIWLTRILGDGDWSPADLQTGVTDETHSASARGILAAG